LGAPLSFEVEHIELLMPGHLVDEQSLDVRVQVSKGAELFVLAGLDVLGAVLCLILGDVVETLDLVVRELARLHITAVVNWANLNVVRVLGVAPSTILQAVVAKVQLRVVSLQCVLTQYHYSRLTSKYLNSISTARACSQSGVQRN
jgi:hypothetical protein